MLFNMLIYLVTHEYSVELFYFTKSSSGHNFA